MRKVSQARSGVEGSLQGTERRRRSKSPDGELRPLKNQINNSTVGIAVYDRNLLCRALNDTLATMHIISAGQQVGKSVQQVFGFVAEQLEPMFQRVLDTGRNVSDFPLTARLAGKSGERHWSVSFYPVKDESGRVWMVAATFAEVTKRNGAENLSNAAASSGKDWESEPRLLSGELCELLARSIKLSQRSVQLLEETISLRFQASETHLEKDIEPLHLFLTASRSTSRGVLSEVNAIASEPECPEPPASAARQDDVLSPRERQVLNLLTDGKSNKEIGFALQISTRTVETYRARLTNKLKLHSTAELVRYAIRNKIIEP